MVQNYIDFGAGIWLCCVQYYTDFDAGIWLRWFAGLPRKRIPEAPGHDRSLCEYAELAGWAMQRRSFL